MPTNQERWEEDSEEEQDGHYNDNTGDTDYVLDNDDTGGNDTEDPQGDDSEDAGMDITPTKRATGSDGTRKRDNKMKNRVIACLKDHGLRIHRCLLTNSSTNTVGLEYAHLLPLATPEIMVGFLKRSMAVTI